MASESASDSPTPSPTSPSSEAPSEPVTIDVPLAELLDVPGVSRTRNWLRVGPVRRRTSFPQWVRGRGLNGEAAALAEQMDEQYSFQREVEVAFVHRKGARSVQARTRQVLISSFKRTDASLSEAWCSVDEQGPAAVELGSSQRVADAVDALVALPGSCGAVRRLPGKSARFQADISFRHGPLMVQVVAVEAQPVLALEGIAMTAPRLHRQIVAATS